MLGTVGVIFLVVVLVAGGERQAGSGISPQGTLQGTERVVLLDLERVLGFLSSQTEGELDSRQVTGPVRELNVEDVAAVFGNGVDLLQPQPELSWKKKKEKS